MTFPRDDSIPSRKFFDTQQEICYPAGNVGYLVVFRTKILGGVRGLCDDDDDDDGDDGDDDDDDDDV